MPRVAVVALDACEWDLASRLIARGELPNLGRLRDRGATCRLRSPMSYRAEAPWTDFLTGTSASTRRFWTPMTFDPVTYSCSMGRTAPNDPFFKLGPGHTVVAFDVPKATDADGTSGCQVTGWGVHANEHPPISRPNGLLEALSSEVGEHPGFAIEYDGAWNQSAFLERLASAHADGASKRADITRRLLTRYPDWDLLIMAMGESHNSGHQMWHGVDEACLQATTSSARAARSSLTTIYRALDRSLGDVLELLPDDVVVVAMSPHGMGPGDSETTTMVLIPELLHRVRFGSSLLRGTDETVWRRHGCPPIDIPDWQSPTDYLARRFGRSARETRRLEMTERLHTATAPTIHRVAPGLISMRRHLRDRRTASSNGPADEAANPQVSHDASLAAWNVSCWYRQQWPRMPAFVVPGFADAHVRINLEGRERDGCVPAADYGKCCDDLEATLRACSDVRTGKPIVADVQRMRADDPFAPDGPTADLVVQVTNGVDALSHPDVGTIGPFPPSRTGTHNNLGFAVVAGPGVPHATLGERPLVDLTATLVSMMSSDVPAGLSGRPITELTFAAL